MKTGECLQTLLAGEHIADDFELVSTNNKLVVISEAEGTVTRIGPVNNTNERDDPHDLSYSHAVAHFAGEVAPIVRPIDKEPIIVGNYLLSRYPLMHRSSDLRQATAVYRMLHLTARALDRVASDVHMRRLDISKYVGQRLRQMQDVDAYDQKAVALTTHIADEIERKYPFAQLVNDNPALVHGDCKVDNVVSNSSGEPMLIDLDAAAVGPGQFDLASWRLRSELGDQAPVESYVDQARQHAAWNEESYRALVGWKALSSISFTLRYSHQVSEQNEITPILEAAIMLGGLPKQAVSGLL